MSMLAEEQQQVYKLLRNDGHGNKVFSDYPQEEVLDIVNMIIRISKGWDDVKKTEKEVLLGIFKRQKIIFNSDVENGFSCLDHYSVELPSETGCNDVGMQIQFDEYGKVIKIGGCD